MPSWDLNTGRIIGSGDDSARSGAAPIQSRQPDADLAGVPASILQPPPIPYARPVTTPAGLSQQQVAQLLLARDRAAKLRRAGNIAKFDAWMISIFAALTGLTGIFSASSLLLAGAMGYVAWREFRGAAQLRKLDPTAAGALARNQLVLAGALIVYAMWQGYASYTSHESLTGSAGGDAQLTQMLGPIDEMMKMLTLSVYGLLIFIAIFVQGGTALYYKSREKYLKAYVEQTPPWITELQRAGVQI
jgi:hypothetical protein